MTKAITPDELKKAEFLFRSMLARKDESIDYLTTQLKRGGFYYRSLADLFKSSVLEIHLDKDKVTVKSKDKVIIFEHEVTTLLQRHL